MALVTFLFFCPACLRDADATADPVDILFGGGDLNVTCLSCEAVFHAVLEQESGTIEIKEETSAR